MHSRRGMGDMRLRAGDIVSIRDQRWRVAGESPFGAVSILEVAGCDATNDGIRTRFLLPFDTVHAVAALPCTPRPRTVTVKRWRRAARAVLSDVVPHWTSLRAAARANVTILPFQLEPAMAIVAGDACRVLIADEVGLGKTIQAGLIIGETLARTPDARVLIVVPAGLRDQWREELQSRFDLHAEVLDAQGLARTAAELVPDVNPWSVHAIVITSIDYIKRAEVMRSLETLIWDVLVFDEAHALTGRSDRATASAALARRARAVVMLTATPHSGDEQAFARLRALGDLRDAFPVTTFHRTRSDVGLPRNRRSTILRVRPTTAEAAMHSALDDYVKRLAQESAGGAGSSLLCAILLRRACSSAASLARSLQRRMTLLLDGEEHSREQLTLPFLVSDSDDEPAWELGVPGLRDSNEERRWLQHLTELAENAAAGESKVRVLETLFRRIKEPALVFTEYRDTLQHISEALQAFAPLTLHGGLNGRDRAAVIRQFTEGHRSVLLATDAASEGLNLHQRCRVVVNLEMPWTPTRLEQRIGRVDRLGQPRRVHALKLIARGTHDETTAALLNKRSERIDFALETAREDHAHLHAARSEARRVLTTRALSAAGGPPTVAAPFVTFVTSTLPAPAEVRAYRLSFVDESGRSAFETIVGAAIDDNLVGHQQYLELALAEYQEGLLTAVATAIGRWLELALRRVDAMTGALRDSHARLSATLLQPGLFDRRAERAAAAQAARVDEALDRLRVRLDALGRLKRLRCDERRLLFGIKFRP